MLWDLMVENLLTETTDTENSLRQENKQKMEALQSKQL